MMPVVIISLTYEGSDGVPWMGLDEYRCVRFPISSTCPLPSISSTCPLPSIFVGIQPKSSLAAGEGASPTWPSASLPLEVDRRRLPSPASLALRQDAAGLNTLLQGGAIPIDYRRDMGQRAAGAPPACVLPNDDGDGPHIGQVLHALLDGMSRPVKVVQLCPDPQYFLGRWCDDSSLSVLPVAKTVPAPYCGALGRETGPGPGAGCLSQGQGPSILSGAGGPPLAVDQAVVALFEGEWHPGRVRRLFPERGEVQVLWDSQYSKTNLPAWAVRPAPEVLRGTASSSGTPMELSSHWHAPGTVSEIPLGLEEEKYRICVLIVF